jgi:hemerythrin-like metal-binding protein
MDRYADVLSLGVKTMDTEHRHLAALFDDFAAALKDGAPRERVNTIVEQALAATNEHFDSEERLMEKAGYPEIEEEKRQHRMLRMKMTTLAGDILNMGTCDPITLENIGAMQQLLYEHMDGPDRDLANYLIPRGIQ